MLFLREPQTSRINRLAKDAVFSNCGKKGHFKRICRPLPNLRYVINALNHSRHIYFGWSFWYTIKCHRGQYSFEGSGKYGKFTKLCRRVCFAAPPTEGYTTLQCHISMASVSLISHTKDHCLLASDSLYSHSCAGILLGHNFSKLYESIEIPFNGAKPTRSLRRDCLKCRTIVAF